METRLSIIAPLYNEGIRLPAGIESIRHYIDQRTNDTEVILVNDGSTDDTIKVAKGLIKDDPRFKLVSYRNNQGKGHAVKIGMAKAVGSVRIFMDIDMSVPIETVDPFLEKIEQGADVVIGTRRVSQSNVIVHQPKFREVLGEVYRRFVRAVFAPGVSDFTCGFKAFSGDLADKVFAQSRINRWSFDTEILFLVKRWGVPIQEIPVSWTNSPGTKVNLLIDVGRSAMELILIRWNWAAGRYTQK
jgi:dolichyl-phosphate beta-glucosyltransferase